MGDKVDRNEDGIDVGDGSKKGCVWVWVWVWVWLHMPVSRRTLYFKKSMAFKACVMIHITYK